MMIETIVRHEAGPESNGGCKLADLDNDGIPNIDDKCPNESGSKEFNGCPKIAYFYFKFFK